LSIRLSSPCFEIALIVHGDFEFDFDHVVDSSKLVASDLIPAACISIESELSLLSNSIRDSETNNESTSDFFSVFSAFQTLSKSANAFLTSKSLICSASSWLSYASTRASDRRVCSR